MAEKPILLRCLCGAWVELPNAELRITARKKVAVLAYLAFTQQRVPRELLAGLIWEEASEAKARGSLRQTLSELRSASPALRQALQIDRTTVALVGDPIETETEVLLQELANGVIPDVLRGGGEFLEDVLYGFDTIGERFGEWVRDLRTTFGNQLMLIISQSAERQDLMPTQRMALAELALALDPLREQSCRFAMQLAVDLGDIGKALQIYSTFYGRMEAVLDMEPSDETQDLAADIKLKADSISTTVPPAVPLPSAVVSSTSCKPVLAILPMQMLDTNPGNANLGDLLVDDMILRLVKQNELSVVSRVSIRHLAQRPDVAHVLHLQRGIGYLVSGSIRTTPDGLCLNVELSRTEDGHILWAEQFLLYQKDIADTQHRIATEVVHHIIPRLRDAELSESKGVELTHLSAYQRVLSAQELIFTLSHSNFMTAGKALRSIAENWPNFALAHLGLADWHSLLLGQGWSEAPPADLHKVTAHLEAALSIQRRNSRALAMLGHNKAVYARQYDEALCLIEEALQLAPGDAETLLWSGPALAYDGQGERALEQLLVARSLNFDDPLGFRYDHFVAIAHFALGDMSAAAEAGRASIVGNGRYTSNLRLTAAASAAINDMQTARELSARTMLLEPDFRVSKLVSNHAFRSPAQRALYGHLLRKAGLPN